MLCDLKSWVTCLCGSLEVIAEGNIAYRKLAFEDSGEREDSIYPFMWYLKLRSCALK